MAFLHAMIRVKDLEASKKFYCELVGLKASRELRLEDATLYYFVDESTGAEIEFTVNDDIPSEGYKVGDSFGHFAFSVDMDEMIKKVNELGYKWMYEPFTMQETGRKIAFIKDPDGNQIEFIAK